MVSQTRSSTPASNPPSFMDARRERRWGGWSLCPPRSARAAAPTPSRGSILPNVSTHASSLVSASLSLVPPFASSSAQIWLACGLAGLTAGASKGSGSDAGSTEFAASVCDLATDPVVGFETGSCGRCSGGGSSGGPSLADFIGGVGSSVGWGSSFDRVNGVGAEGSADCSLVSKGRRELSVRSVSDSLLAL